MPSVIRLIDVHKIYDAGDVRVHALRGVTLEIEQGGFVAIMARRDRASRP